MLIRIRSNHGCTSERDMWGIKEAVMAPDKEGQNDSSSLVYEEEYLYETVN